MRIIFAGTPQFAAESLHALLSTDHDIVAVLTQPDRPSGRGRKLKASVVKQLAQEHQINVYQPTSLKDPSIQQLIDSFNADVMIVVAYGLLLPREVLELPKHGCLNIHASLLPRWRGAAPIQRAIQAGDQKSGISIMQMDEGLDTGDVLRIKEIDIEANDTSASLHDKLAMLGATLIVETLAALEQDALKPQSQDESMATYAAKLDRQESYIDWQQPAASIVNQIHAFNPWPGARTRYLDTELKLLRAAVVDNDSELSAGTVIASEKTIQVKCGEQAVQILQLQKPGSRAMPSEEFLNGFEFQEKAMFV